uniref:LRRNT domain-containing protein n=1 Tax=Periophthalmus magnuspinnatus TaxID=409849 RepID=A0A3B4AG66_9GOBI
MLVRWTGLQISFAGPCVATRLGAVVLGCGSCRAVYDEPTCPSDCFCSPSGVVNCAGYTIIDIPGGMPVHTYRLEINGTNIHLHTIHPAAFNVAPQLKSLMLYNNELEGLEPGMFDTLVELEELKIHQNRISSLPPKVFWCLKNLKNLTLSSNQLQTIPGDSFTSNTALRAVSLSLNPWDYQMCFFPEWHH